MKKKSVCRTEMSIEPNFCPDCKVTYKRAIRDMSKRPWPPVYRYPCCGKEITFDGKREIPRED